MARIKGIQIDGFKELYQKMGLLEEEIEKAAMKGVRNLAYIIFDESQKLVPIDSHTLQESGFVSIDKKNKIATIAYNTPYARKQHEDNTLDHSQSKIKHGQGQAKYLERPFNEKSDELETYVGESIDKVLRRK